MLNKLLVSVMLLTITTFLGIRPAHAQFAVIDVASIGQLIQQLAELQQQVATARSQLAQAQSEYAAMTGGRGMESLLSGTTRNYLPTDWGQVSQVLGGSSGGYPGFSADFNSLMASNAVLTPTQVRMLTPAQQQQLAAARQSPAFLQATARSALENASGRFASLQQLISSIGSATDQKAALDLTARIAAEQTMLQNEQTKLQALYQIARSQEAARVQRMQEQAVADQGSLRNLPALGL